MTILSVVDKAPNQELVEFLERALEYAKTGELTSIVAVFGWNDDRVTHGWRKGDGNSPRRLLAEIVMLQHDFVTAIEMLEKDSVTFKAMNGEWEI